MEKGGAGRGDEAPSGAEPNAGGMIMSSEPFPLPRLLSHSVTWKNTQSMKWDTKLS